MEHHGNTVNCAIVDLSFSIPPKSNFSTRTALHTVHAFFKKMDLIIRTHHSVLSRTTLLAVSFSLLHLPLHLIPNLTPATQLLLAE